MKTDWNLIREALGTVIDSCERLEALGYRETHRNLTVDVGDRPVSVWEFLTSAATLAENARYQVIRERHDQQMDLRYVPETARMLVATTAACAELIGAGRHPPAERCVKDMIDWYRNYFDPHVADAINSAAADDASS
ncbi:hypothetical protein [Paraburkholderia caballeronis]|uniref:Uncharacterized protein n=1 Tax=Paraburkholderia caballeronis TaxID=416943 RepID=A0A1H7UG20_9BURK|nr:hypothetical protein [Paraburkholderia caballeronis]PXW17532.1 hypothetical protein C7403_11870 [Paraburkholderia caballeronis]PXW95121.1 hypothetical protein C7407_11870 [Paraburkholderia caballeronis]RAJ90967.1 hypothetical protein C7409_11870 [Paraburkholderia caballeronis]SEE19415.1 hypothetical protein SAMN05445871_4884 [Paraburkholderia caballeronis]SEL96022.1 hypothetical protein SAMN05192542_11921 [Paraburkholderia caballeronis]